MKYQQRVTYIALPIVLILLVILRSEAMNADVVWLEWTSHFLWGISFLVFGIWMIYIDQQERKEESANDKSLSFDGGIGGLRRIDWTLGLAFLIIGVAWILIVAYSLVKSPGILNG